MASANAGKNKLARHMRLYHGGVDLSGDAREFGQLLWGYTPVDLTGWSESMRNYLPDRVMQSGIVGFSAFINDATGGAFTRMKAPGTKKAVSLFFGGGAAPVVGDIAYLIQTIQTMHDATWNAAAGVISGDFMPDSAGVSGANNPFGLVLMPSTTISSTTTGTAVDYAAGGTGYSAALHVTGTSSGNYAFSVETDAAGTFAGSETTLFSFSIDGSSIASEYIASATATVQRYNRLVATRTAGSVSIAVAMAINY